MGLDQYLHARKYVGAWNHTDEETKATYRQLCAEVGVKDWRCEGAPSLTVEVSVAYWRKANQIHKWFVDNVQDGNDDCRGYYVDREDLEKLRDTCKTVLASSKLVAGQVVNGQTGTAEGWKDNVEEGQIVENTSVARELLPTNIEGCFFGSEDYDQWYWHDLESTVEQLDAALERFGDGWDFEYRASW
jgi:hypothetical protein